MNSQRSMEIPTFERSRRDDCVVRYQDGMIQSRYLELRNGCEGGTYIAHSRYPETRVSSTGWCIHLSKLAASWHIIITAYSHEISVMGQLEELTEHPRIDCTSMKTPPTKWSVAIDGNVDHGQDKLKHSVVLTRVNRKMFPRNKHPPQVTEISPFSDDPHLRLLFITEEINFKILKFLLNSMAWKVFSAGNLNMD